MAKNKKRATAPASGGRSGTAQRSAAGEATGINPRQSCPCGSGRRYKACHGAADAADMIVARPFSGLACETELVAMREFVPSATAPIQLNDATDDTPSLTLGSVLPGAAAALTRSDGSILIGSQVQTHSGDLSRDIASAIEWALAAEPSSVLSTYPRASVGKRLQDLLADEPLAITVHDDFTWWLEEEPEPGSTLATTLERANAAIMPTAKLSGLPGAYWVDTGEKAHLRWVRGEEEPALMAALARLADAGNLDLGDGSRYVGSFRADGCVVPVWDLDRDAHASEWEQPAARFAELLETALADEAPLTDSQRRARDGILGRQFTLR